MKRLTRRETVDRRTFLTGVAGGFAALAGCASGSSDGDRTGESPSDDGADGGRYGGWFDGVGNYDGAVDGTGRTEVRVVVGAGNGLQFEPAAIRVSPGATVVWEWSGRGGQHNVRHVDGDFVSDLSVAEGHTFEHTFDSAGVYRYICAPHQAQRMRGAVDVVEE